MASGAHLAGVLCRYSTVIQVQGTQESICSIMLKPVLHYAIVAKLVGNSDLSQLCMLLSDT